MSRGRQLPARPNFNPTEREVVYLAAVQWLTNELTSRALFSSLGPHVQFKERTHQRLFFILLNDLLAEANGAVVGEQKEYLDALISICERPAFDVGDSKLLLHSTATRFKAWLDEEIEFEIYLSAARIDTPIKLSREVVINVAGNLQKHNFSRMNSLETKLRQPLLDQSQSATLHELLKCRDDIEAWFVGNVLTYHTSRLVEFVNNLRWGIHEYLLPEYQRAYRMTLDDPEDPNRWTFDKPDLIRHDFAVECYWALMNGVMNRPTLPMFSVEPGRSGKY